MTIDRINSAEPIQPNKKAGQAGRVERESESDSITISQEALDKAELARAIEAVSRTEDVRAERVAELKKKINDPSYLNDTIVKATAEKILDAFGL